MKQEELEKDVTMLRANVQALETMLVAVIRVLPAVVSPVLKQELSLAAESSGVRMLNSQVPDDFRLEVERNLLRYLASMP